MLSVMQAKSCFRKGCLLLFLLPLIVGAVLFFVFRSSHDLPGRFVLTVPLGGSLEEIGSVRDPFPLSGEGEQLSFQDMLFILDHAAGDNRVETVLLEIGNLQVSPAKITELRSAIAKVRAGGRKVVAWLHSAEDSDYHLASACDSVIVERGGYLLLDGLKAETLFYTAPLEKLGIAFQATQWKEYKSGIEPFTRTGASPEYLAQVGGLLDAVYGDYTAYVSKQRGISRDSFESVIDNIALVQAEKAVKLGLADGVASRWELKRSMARRISGKEPEKADDLFVSAAVYRESIDWPAKADTDDAVAVITLSGPIIRSASGAAMASDEGADVGMLRRSLDAALEDNKVKAMVLRIDSPGGDAFAAADMLQMLDSAAVKKPLVVSMSGVAASGGYMAALAGKTVFAQPLTVTGSIGVYALKPDISALAARTGLGRDVVTRGRFADANTVFKPLEGEAYRKFDEASGYIYEDFVAKVGRSRKMSAAAVDSVAGGRVWIGRQALERGLADRMGGLFDAVREAQRLAKMDVSKKPRILLYPERQSWWQMFFDGSPAAVARAFGAAAIGEAVSPLPSGAMLRMIAIAARSGRVQMLAAMPGEIIIR